MTSIENELLEAIEGLYQAFSNFPLREDFVARPGYFSEAEKSQVRAKRLRDLTWQDMGRYPERALSTFGEISDFKHFLPRILELRILIRPSWPDLEVILGKLRMADLPAWPVQEREAVTRFLFCLWQVAISRYPMEKPVGCDVSALVCGLAASSVGLTQVLEHWETLPTEASALHLSEFVSENLSVLLKRNSFANAFWQKDWPERAHLTAWLRHASLAQGLESAFFRSQDGEIKARLSEAHGLLLTLQARV